MGGGGWGGVYYRSWNVDHVVDAPLQMITLYHAPRQGGVGWWGGVGCIIVRGMLITLYHAPRQGGVGWGVGWGGVYYRSWNVDHVVDAPLQSSAVGITWIKTSNRWFMLHGQCIIVNNDDPLV